MKTYLLICSILFLASPSQLRAQALKDLNQVEIIVEDPNQIARSFGITTEVLESQTLVALKRDLPNIKITSNPALSFVHITVTAVEAGNGVSVHVSVEVVRPVRIILDDNSEGGKTNAAVWSKGVLLDGPVYNMGSRVRETLSNKITDLAADYFRQSGR